MNWVRIDQRFTPFPAEQALPLVLAGPILRRVESRAVTVWIVLRETRTLRLQVFDITGASPPQMIFESAERQTIELGPRFHLLAITARGSNAALLVEGRLYGYNMGFFAQAAEKGHYEHL